MLTESSDDQRDAVPASRLQARQATPADSRPFTPRRRQPPHPRQITQRRVSTRRVCDQSERARGVKNLSLPVLLSLATDLTALNAPPHATRLLVVVYVQSQLRKITMLIRLV